MILFWYFLLYSFLGFLLEVLFAWSTGGHPQRKCLLLLPLCPVYGLGACLIVGTAGHFTHPLLIFFAGAVLSTACEYIMAAFYEDVLLVSFWDYSDLPLNLHGRVCLPFSLAWGLLSVPLVRRLHPAILSLHFAPPPPLTAVMAAALVCDTAVSALLLRHFHTRDALDWYLPRA